MKRINEIRVASSLKKANDSKIPTPTDETGYVWVISAFLNEDADKLCLCTGGGFR